MKLSKQDVARLIPAIDAELLRQGPHFRVFPEDSSEGLGIELDGWVDMVPFINAILIAMETIPSQSADVARKGEGSGRRND